MLSDQINKRLADSSSSPFFSLEFFPPQRDLQKNLDDFFETLNYLKQSNPLFVDITWSGRNDPGNLCKKNSSSAIANATKEIFGQHRTMLHICCNEYTKEKSLGHVEQALRNGIRNIMALRGDDLPGEMQSPAAEQNGHCPTKHFAIDLVKWVREMEKADKNIHKKLTVAVAGHMHPPLKTVTYAQCMEHLKAKVDAGADFIVTQFFLEVQLFEKFRADCQSIGIKVPILPGILLFKSVASLNKMAELANVPIPDHIARHLERIGTDQSAVQSYAMQMAFEMSKHILSTGQASGIHFFTLNQREMCSKLLRRLGFWPTINTAEPKLVNGTANGHLAQIQNGKMDGEPIDELIEAMIKSKMPMINGQMANPKSRTSA